jgi:hypothetical protein
MNGSSANFDRRLTKLENSKLGVPANLVGFRAPTITVHEGEDEDQIIKEMEARGEIPPPENFPVGRIRVIVVRVISETGSAILPPVPNDTADIRMSYDNSD